MADNTVLPGTGETYASDDIAGTKFQRVKLIHGADGVNDGDSSTTNGFPIRSVGSSTVIETSTTPLLSGATFTSQTFDTSVNGHGFTVSAASDKNGHTYHDQSINGTDWISADDYTYTQPSGHHEEHIAHMRYNRFRFVNDSGENQTTFTFSVVQRFMDGFGTIKISDTQNAVTQGTDEPWTFIGNKQNNFAAPGGTNFGTLPAVATAAAPSHTEGYQVGVSTTLTGDTRITLDGESVPVTATDLDIRNLVAAQDTVVVTGGAAQTADVKVTLDSETVALVANSSVNVSQINGVTPLMGAGNTGTGSPRVTIATDQVVIPVKLQGATSGGHAGYTAISTAAVLSAAIKASPGGVYGYSFFNNTASAIFVRLYNMTTAPGTGDTPVRRIMVPANGGVERTTACGFDFSTGIAIRATGLAPDNDATALTANTVLFNVDYE